MNPISWQYIDVSYHHVVCEKLLSWMNFCGDGNSKETNMYGTPLQTNMSPKKGTISIENTSEPTIDFPDTFVSSAPLLKTQLDQLGMTRGTRPVFPKRSAWIWKGSDLPTNHPTFLGRTLLLGMWVGSMNLLCLKKVIVPVWIWPWTQLKTSPKCNVTLLDLFCLMNVLKKRSNSKCLNVQFFVAVLARAFVGWLPSVYLQHGFFNSLRIWSFLRFGCQFSNVFTIQKEKT